MADIDEAPEFLKLVSEADSENRASGMEDLRFRFGDQWPAQIQNSRKLENRPALTINETDAYCRQITNAMRQQQPRIKAHPVDSGADVKVAEIITGLCRHIEVNSDAANAYDMAGDFAVSMGWGYWRIRTDYIREDSFDQDIYIDPVENPFSVYFDPNSSLPDGSDAERALVADMMTKKAFRQEWPGADEANFDERATGDMTSEWITKEDIRIAEFMKVERTKARLVALSSGDAVYEDELPSPEILMAAGVTVIGDRESYKKKIIWRKQTAVEILDEKVWPGRWIPIIPTYGVTLVIDGRRKRMGAVRFARDPQMMINFWKTTITESIAQAPKTKWLIAEGQDEGHENDWATANTSAIPYLRYKQHDIAGNQAPVPTRVQPEPPPEGAIVASMGASEDLRKVMGVFEPASRQGGQHKSDKTLRAERAVGEESNYHFYDNLTRSIKHTGRVILDLQRKVYDTKRVMRIIGADGKPDLVTINDKQMVDGVQKVLNDVTVGTYDVVMETGPGYNTKREEGLEAMMNLMDTPLGEKIAQIADDLVVRLIDVPGMEALADRLAAANPLAQIDAQSDIPPKVQMMIKGLQQQLQQCQQALQQAGIEIKFGLQKEQLKQDGETKRTLMKTTAEMHKEELEDQTWRYDIDRRTDTTAHDTVIKTETQKDIEALKAHLAILLQRMEERANKETQASEEATERAI